MIPRLKLLILLFMIEPKWFDIKHIPIRRKCFTVIFGKKEKNASWIWEINGCNETSCTVYETPNHMPLPA